MSYSAPDPARSAPHFLAPEVVQTSAMDCGPAALKALFEGFGIPVSYGRLREACQTDVDGTSIDTLEDVANQLGLDVEQVVAPLDHILRPEEPITPALVVVRQPNGLTHFVLIWRLHGDRFVQIMDPARGRRWLSCDRFLDDVYLHRLPFPAEVWREWAGSPGFCDPLRWRLTQLKIDSSLLDKLLTAAQADSGWRSMAALDATTRMVTAIVAAGGLTPGAEAGSVLERLFEGARQSSPGPENVVPPVYWLVQPLAPEQNEPEESVHLIFQGAVLLQVFGRRPPPTDSTEVVSEADETEADESDETADAAEPAAETEPPPPLSPELAAALDEDQSRPEFEILRLLRRDGAFSLSILTAALGLAAFGVIIQAFLLGSLIEVGPSLSLNGQLPPIFVGLFLLAGLLFVLEIPLTQLSLRVGRRLEMRWRLAFLTKIPRLDDQYFHSRLTSDMAKRAHELQKLRRLPILGFNMLRVGFQLLWTALAIAWLDPASAPLALFAAFLALALPLAAQPLLAELDQRLQAHAGGLSLFYLDALLGLIPIRAHSAARSMRREHESLLTAWAQANLAFYRTISSVEMLTAIINTALAVTLILSYIARSGDTAVALLLAYWSLNIVFLGKSLGDLARQYPRQRNRILSLLEPLNAPEIEPAHAEAGPASHSSGVSIGMENVRVQAGGHTILDGINLTIEAGEQVAIVGPSGAGKSSLVGLLLGWYRPAEGCLLVDGRPLSGPWLQALRQQTVWVDPAVQLWNRTFLHNLRYGSSSSNNNGGARGDINTILREADLIDVLKRLPAGMQTPLGEGGGLVSGGEGQRVRLGRGMLRPAARLVILDEPFRGLDRDQRRELLARARRYWPTATLLCITHDVSQTELFDRVAVIENGRLVEDGSPATLADRPDSRYRTLLCREEAVRTDLWANSAWRRLWLDRGRLQEREPQEA